MASRAPGHVWARRSDLQGEELTAAVMNYPPFTIFDEITGQVSGYNVEYLHQLAASMNFTLKPVMYSEESNDDYDDDDSWNMLIDDLENMRVDAALHTLYRTPERLERIPFSDVVHSVNHLLATRRDLVATEHSSVFSMFGSDVWITGGATVLAIMLAGSASAVAKEKSLRSSGQVLDETSILFGAILSQGSTLDGDRNSSKILLLTALLFGILSVTSLSARLICTLSVRRQEDLVRDLDDVLDLQLPLYLNSGGYAEFAFRDAPNTTTRHRLWKNRVVLTQFMSDADFVRHFLQVDEKAAAVVHPIIVKTLMRSNAYARCQLAIRKLEGQIDVGKSQ